MKTKYSKYKSSGVEWVGEIPSHWIRTKISFYCQVKDGTHDTPQYVDLGGFPLVTQKDITLGKLDFTKTKNISEKDFIEINKRSNVVYDDIIMSMIGSIGNPTIVDTHSPFSIKNVCLFKTSQSKEITRYVHYYLQSDVLNKELEINQRGGVQGFVSLDVLRNLLYIKPPIPEQEEIVKYLDEKTTQVDNLISITEKKIETLKEKRSSLINTVVTKGLNPKVELKDSGVEWIGEIPKHWEVSKIKYIPKEGRNSFIDGDWIESSVITETGIRYITTGNIGEGYYKEQGKGFISEHTFEKLNCSEIFEGDLVMSRLFLPIGRCCIIPNLGFRVITSVDNVILRPKEGIEKRFLIYQFNCQRFFEYTELISRGTTLTRISRTMLGDTNCFIPPLPEQEQIIKYLDTETKKIDTLVSIEQRRIETLKEYRQSLISEVVTGKVRVCEEEVLKQDLVLEK